MVITVLEARIEASMYDQLQKAYREHTGMVPDSIVQSYLIQDQSDQNRWQILTIWRSVKDLVTMRASGETPTGVLIFNTVGAKPELSISDIRQTT